MDKKKSKILVLVEGPRTDVSLMKHLLDIYGISQSHQIVSYNTNIYTLYNRMFRDGNPETIDILQVLKEREFDPEKRKILDEKYSDILLIFDLDPQAPDYSADKIVEMMDYFVESSDMGKLYLNYPMVEAFYHMKQIPDEDYNSYFATLVELKNKAYKSRVNAENRNHDYTKFAVDKKECDIVIKQNIDKAFGIIGESDYDENTLPDATDILNAQINKIQLEKLVSVLCTCVFYIPEYNPKLLTPYDTPSTSG